MRNKNLFMSERPWKWAMFQQMDGVPFVIIKRATDEQIYFIFYNAIYITDKITDMYILPWVSTALNSKDVRTGF